MKHFQKATTGIGILLLGLVIFGFTACPSGTDSPESARTPVSDGTYITEGIGKSVTTPITVSTTFVSNTLIDISIGTNGETGPILDSVKTLMVPRIIEAQSIGVDSIAGATLSSSGIKQAVAAAIDEAGGKSDEWYISPPTSSKTVKLTGYDVIVVGLGGAGMSAYLKAAEEGAIVYGIEWGGKIGGNSATAGGPMAVNSEYIKNLYTGGADYANRDALLKEWYADMEADVPADEIPAVSYADADNVYAVPDVTTKMPAYQGGPKWALIKQLIDESGATVTWLAQQYNFHFARPTGLGYPQYNIVTNYGNEQWDNTPASPPYFPGPGYASDDGDDLYKTTMFTRAIENAKAKNSKNGYKLELRATGLIMSNGKVAGVKAAYRDGTIYEVYGKAVILATGGFIGSRNMKMTHFGTDLREEAVHTDQGDGITMAINDAGANTYNITMPPMVHIAQVKNIVSDTLFADSAKDTLYKTVPSSLLLKGDSLVVGLHAMPNYDLDLRGKRFSNEASMMMGGIAFENWKVGGYYAAIFSNDVLADIKTKGAKFTSSPMFLGQGNPPGPDVPIPDLDDILTVSERRGNVVRAATLEALADALGVPAANLKETVRQYNAYVSGTERDSEYDKSNTLDFSDFQIKNFYTTNVTEDNVTAGGYTAILGAGYYYGTCGGLDIDEDMQVLDKDKAKIPGLYAVGQDSMGVLFNAKKAYVGYGAAAQGWAITSGRLAGANAATEAKK
ncbi:MAG: FAD-binding protein [Treponema sp.]|jgi:uncharacterized protein with FMN-binding domain|nr:FAD-binding protein [Treponema sp.]